MSVPTRYRARQAVEPPAPDAPGYDFKPDPARIRTVAELADGLERLRRWVGAPSLREISSRCVGGQPSHSTFSTMLRGDRLPAMDQVLVFVTALGLHDDLPQWAGAWRRVASERRRKMTDVRWTIDGRLIDTPDISGMMSPVRCTHCRGVYDLGTVTVTARYTDCSMWRSPCCNLLVDDRGETGWKSRGDYVRLDGK